MRSGSPPPPPSLLPVLAAFALPLACACALCWPLPLSPDSAWFPSLFGASHAWTGEHLWQALTQGEPLHSTLRAGYPWERTARFIGWLPMLGTLPLRTILGPLACFHLGLLLALPLSSLAAWPLLRRWSGAGPWAVAAGCVAFALCPFALGTFGAGELPKLCIGLIPLFLYALDRALEPGWRWPIAAAVLATATGFTSPYFGLTLPLLCLGLLGWDVWRQRRLWRPLGCGLAVAVALLPVAAYYKDVQGPTWRSLHMPAQSPGVQDLLPTPHPSASLLDLLLGIPPELQHSWDTRHVAYLGSALALALAVLAWRQRGEQRAGQWAAWVLLATGALLALGPYLYLESQRTLLPLPAVLLALVRYPLVSGGMYYRLAVVGSLGLALWLVVACARRPRLAWLLLLLQIGDALRASGPWPLMVEPVPGVALLRDLGGDDGAVLVLPYGGGLVPSQRALLLATHHGRPTTALPRMFLPREQVALRDLWVKAFMAEDPAQALRARGIRFVLSEQASHPGTPWVDGALGTPTMEQDGLRVWDMGPTTLAPRSVDELDVEPSGPRGGGPRNPRPRRDERRAR
jgi:hypothetical protein